MAWSFGGFRGSNSNKTSGPTLSVSPNAQINAGAVVIAVAISDNVVTNGAQTTTHVVTDFKGNVWTKILEQTNTAAVGVGITGSLWVSQLAANLLTTDLVVFGISAAATAKAIGLYEYGIGAGNFLRIVTGAGSQQDNTSAPTVSLNSIPNDSYALFGMVARENDDAGTYTMDADYNERQKFGTTGGTGNTNVSAIVGDRLATLTGDTFNPTGLSTAADVVSILAVLKEVVPIRETVTDVENTGGKVFVRFGKHEREFGSLEEARQFASFDGGEGREILHRLAMNRYLRLDPDGSNPGIMEGHSITFTNELNRMVEVF